MRTLVVGNSHIVGLKNAIEAANLPWSCIPIPLCDDFEVVVREGGRGVFRIAPLWKNMTSKVHEQKHRIVEFDLTSAQEDGLLILVGQYLFGCFKILAPLISAKPKKCFRVCVEGSFNSVPYDSRLQLLSLPCFKESLTGEILALAESYKWLTSRFRHTLWIPSPSPPQAFAIAKFHPAFRWYVSSGLHRNYLRVFNECLLAANQHEAISRQRITFLPHVLDGVNNNGFLKLEYCHNPDIVADIHANGAYYSAYLSELSATAGADRGVISILS